MYSDDIFNLNLYGLLYLGLGSYVYYEYESDVHENWALGISPGLKINERSALTLRFQYYSGLSGDSSEPCNHLIVQMLIQMM